MIELRVWGLGSDLRVQTLKPNPYKSNNKGIKYTNKFQKKNPRGEFNIRFLYFCEKIKWPQDKIRKEKEFELRVWGLGSDLRVQTLNPTNQITRELKKRKRNFAFPNFPNDIEIWAKIKDGSHNQFLG